MSRSVRGRLAASVHPFLLRVPLNFLLPFLLLARAERGRRRSFFFFSFSDCWMDGLMDGWTVRGRLVLSVPFSSSPSAPSLLFIILLLLS